MTARPAILVVEDNEDDVYFMRRAFRATGVAADLHFVGDGRAALEYLRHQGAFADARAHPSPAIVFLDLKLPFLNGLEVLAAIRADATLQAQRVFILTSSNEERDRDRAIALGIEGYFVKPPTKEMLGPILATIAGRPTAVEATKPT